MGDALEATVNPAAGLADFRAHDLVVVVKRCPDERLAALRASGTEILLAGMAAPRNLGETYVKAFDGMYPELASAHGLLLYPFFLRSEERRVGKERRL